MNLVSDIHLEFYSKKFRDFGLFLPSNISPKGIAILAGDIGYPHSEIYKTFIGYASKNYDNVVIVAGNHEYYSKRHDFDTINAKIEEVCSQFNNVYFLNNKIVTIDQIKFIGTTLWTNLEGLSPDISMNDLNFMSLTRIKNNFEKNIKFIEESLQENKNYECVIVSHHLPTFKLLDKQNDPRFFPCYASDLEHIMEKNSNISHWFCGHTHTSKESRIFSTLCAVNPVGYPTIVNGKIISFENLSYRIKLFNFNGYI
jgi:predicted phosphohydrolase